MSAYPERNRRGSPALVAGGADWSRRVSAIRNVGEPESGQPLLHPKQMTALEQQGNADSDRRQ